MLAMKIECSGRTVIDIAASDLRALHMWVGPVTVWELAFADSPPPDSFPVGMITLSGWCSFRDLNRAGVSLHFVGRNVSGEMLWACCLQSSVPINDESVLMEEKCRIDPSAVGQTHRISIRVAGGYFPGFEQMAKEMEDTDETEKGTAK